MTRPFVLKFIFIFCFLFWISSVSSQNSNNGIHFQALAKDNYNNPAKDRVLFIQASILQNNSTGTVLLTEEFKTTTDNNGVFDINIGQGNRVGGTVTNLDAIDWSILPKYLKIKIAITPTAPIDNWDYTKDWIDLGTSLIGSVPNALYAENVKGFNTKLNISDSLNLYVTPSQLKSTTDGLKLSNPAVASLSGINTGDETALSIKTKLGVSSFFSGSYADLSGKPILFTGNYNDLSNKPIIFSGAYNDLTGKPTLFSGSYNDLTNKPTMFSGSYTDLTGKPILFTGNYNDLSNKPTLFSGSYNDLTHKPVLFTGNYNDLTNKPNIPDAQMNSDWNQTDDTQLDYIYNKPIVPNVQNFVFDINSIIATQNDPQNLNTDPVIFGNDNAKIKIQAWSESDTHTTISNSEPESTITLYSNGNGSSQLLWEDANNVYRFSRVEVFEDKIYFRLNDDVNSYDYRWYFNNAGDLQLPAYGTIIFTDENDNNTYLKDILPMPSGNAGYVLTEDGNGGASWQPSTGGVDNLSSLTIYSYGWNPGIFLQQNDITAPTWLRVGNGGGGAEYGVVGAADQFFNGTVQGDIALKAFSSSRDKKMFVGAAFDGKANLELSPDRSIVANGKIFAPALTIGSSSTTSSAALDINSTTKGFLPPRMLESEKNNISSPVAGLIVWCSNCGTSGLGELQVYNGTIWKALHN